MLASVAVQQGRMAAGILLAASSGRPPLPFRYLNYGRLAYVTGSSAIAEVGGLPVTGPLAWVMVDTWHRLLRRHPTASAGPLPVGPAPPAGFTGRTRGRTV